MKKFLKPLLAICFASSLFSCANNTETAKEEPKKADSVAATPAPVAFTPFKVVVIKHKVADYAKWRVGFDAHDSARKASGLTVVGLLRASDNPNDILVANRISDLQKARDFAAMPSLKEVMAKAGVIGKPDITFYETLRYDTSKVEGTGTDIVIVTHKVKDFDAWLKVYDGEGKDKRASEGMVDRVLARGVDDPNLVHIVFAVTDLAKAKAAITSEEKKKLMMSAGVEGKPDIVFYKSAMK